MSSIYPRRQQAYPGYVTDRMRTPLPAPRKARVPLPSDMPRRRHSLWQSHFTPAGIGISGVVQTLSISLALGEAYSTERGDLKQSDALVSVHCFFSGLGHRPGVDGERLPRVE